ncbi:carbohydrate porin (plasmid) [Sphingomonas sp. NY01]|uniref:carbohydrate porin n=1 Tax=Sphingomonas sp. NY01 TaxID=2968057 RepID=UPI00315DD0F8
MRRADRWALAAGALVAGGDAAAQVAAPAPVPPVRPQQRGADSLERGSRHEQERRTAPPRAFELHGGYLSETMTVLSGGRGGGGSDTRYVQEVALGAIVRLDRISALPGTIRVTVTDRRGESLTSAQIGNLVPVQTVVGPSEGTRLTEASWTVPLAGEALDLKAGRLFGQADFNASPRYDGWQLYCQFMSNGICGRPIAVPQNAGFTSYPVSVWAARLHGRVSQRLALSGGVYEVNPGLRERGRGFSLSTRGATGVFVPAEVSLRIGDRDRRHGEIRLGGYYDSSRVDDAVTRLAPTYTTADAAVPGGDLPRRRGRYGGYVLTDFRIQRDRAGEPQGTIVVANLQWGDARTATFGWTGFAGIVRRGTFAGRPDDSVALGLSVNRVNARVGAALARAGFAAPGSERVAEASYGLSIADGVSMRLGLQHIAHPMGLRTRDDVLVGGARLGLDF